MYSQGQFSFLDTEAGKIANEICGHSWVGHRVDTAFAVSRDDASGGQVGVACVGVSSLTDSAMGFLTAQVECRGLESIE